jgi:enoyl-CoA hydratase
MNERYAAYQKLQIRWAEPRVLEVTLLGSGKSNALDAVAHKELARIWRDIDEDIEVSAVLVRGRDAAFAAGGHLDVVEALGNDFDYNLRSWKEARDIVYNIINCGKPIVSAIRGPAAGAGLAVALMADISIASKTAVIVDAHTKIGLPAGDHAVIIWPLLCGMAKAKYYLLTNDPLSGAEAERIGLVSQCVDDDRVYDEAMAVAVRLSKMAPNAVRLTKYSLNNWLRAAGPHFDTSSIIESMCFMGGEVKEGVAAFREKREPNFNPVSHM